MNEWKLYKRWVEATLVLPSKSVWLQSQDIQIETTLKTKSDSVICIPSNVNVHDKLVKTEAFLKMKPPHKRKQQIIQLN